MRQGRTFWDSCCHELKLVGSNGQSPQEGGQCRRACLTDSSVCVPRLEPHETAVSGDADGQAGIIQRWTDDPRQAYEIAPLSIPGARAEAEDIWARADPGSVSERRS